MYDRSFEPPFCAFRISSRSLEALKIRGTIRRAGTHATRALPGRLSLLLLACLVWGLSSPPAAQSQNFSGLLDKELTVVEDLESEVAGLLGRVLGAGEQEGEIEKVVVTDDRERSLTILISLSGFAAADLHGSILDSDKEEISSIAPVKVGIDSTTSEAEMVFALAENLPEGTSLESMYVKLELTRPGRRLVGKSVLYLAQKRWQVAISAENVIVEVVADPLGDSGDPSLAGEFQPSGAAEAGTPAAADTIAVRPLMTPVRRLEPAAAARPDTPTVRRATQPQAAVLQASIRPETFRLVRMAQLKVGLTEAQREKNAQGPSSRPINLLSLKHGGEAFSVQELNSVLGLDSRVYPDKNENSGIFYFIPSAYRLVWDREGGYGLNVFFRTAEAEGEAGEVQMSARLTAAVGVEGLKIARQLVEAWAGRNGRKFESLDPMPLKNSELHVSLSDDLGRLYDIPEDKIGVQSASQLLSDLEVEWVTDDVTANDMMVVLKERGISGRVEIEGEGDVGRLMIPIDISLTGSGTYQPFAWERGGQWRNATVFPLRLRYVHALLLGSDNQPSILSWDLGRESVPPQAQFRIADSAIAPWQEQAALRIWVDYGVDSECESCAQQALDAIRGGSTALARDWISFRTLRPLSDLDAYMITVRVRSRYFHPRGEEYRTLDELELLEDDSSYEVGPIYLPPEYERGELDELFQYQLMVVMPDGTVHPESGDPGWISSNRLRVPIGSAQVRQSVGYLPGEEPPDR